MPMPIELHDLIARYCQLGSMLRWPTDEGCDRDELAMVLAEMDKCAREMTKFGMPDFSRPIEMRDRRQ
jgi:hypothetical protein